MKNNVKNTIKQKVANKNDGELNKNSINVSKNNN